MSHKKTPDDDPIKKDLGIIVEEVAVLESKVSKIIKIENKEYFKLLDEIHICSYWGGDMEIATSTAERIIDLIVTKKIEVPGEIKRLQGNFHFVGLSIPQ